MEMSLASVAPKPAPAAWLWSRDAVLPAGVMAMVTMKKRRREERCYWVARAEGNGGGEAVEGGGKREGGGYTVSGMEVTTFNQSFSDGGGGDFPVWDKIGAAVRFGYGIGKNLLVSVILFLRLCREACGAVILCCSYVFLFSSSRMLYYRHLSGSIFKLCLVFQLLGIYGAMALAGRFICSISGIDCNGGFHPSLDSVVEGLGYAAPPIMALLFILDDEVVKVSPYARAIRDVEDEELRSFFYGMSPWQFMLIVVASSVGEELFYRAAVQGAVAEVFLKSGDLFDDARGMVSLAGLLPPFVPFAQAFAAAITAAFTGSLYYLAASPKDPTFVIAPVLKSRSSRDDLRKLFAAWYERRQMKKIYSPLLEALLALYLGFEWIHTNNILAPIITHGIYSAVILGHGLWKIHDHQRRLRERVHKLKIEAKASRKS
ncbi:hypothetical protein STAS_26818 [Striga asiatica]|uniref:CAAX prenyl protease 2/Lysostaphin resistance protein A-like domain-containing protein n=2 Tax=Magnoliopsida TaxID=3398 RepID=A0A5A7QX47_STRAF|nr:hypothetical protein STAS_26818 [Striga asiatica]